MDVHNFWVFSHPPAVGQQCNPRLQYYLENLMAANVFMKFWILFAVRFLSKFEFKARGRTDS